MVHDQISSYINDYKLLCNRQNRFSFGRLTFASLLKCDAVSRYYVLSHSYGILSSEFVKAFKKARTIVFLAPRLTPESTSKRLSGSQIFWFIAPFAFGSATAFQPPPTSLLVLYKACTLGPYFMPSLLITFSAILIYHHKYNILLVSF